MAVQHHHGGNNLTFFKKKNAFNESRAPRHAGINQAESSAPCQRRGNSQCNLFVVREAGYESRGFWAGADRYTGRILKLFVVSLRVRQVIADR